MTAVGVIPARFASTRFPGKVLADLGGKPLIRHVWEKARQCVQLDDVLIACDHPGILKAASGFGAKAVMTSPDHHSGSDRIAEAVKDLKCDIVVNIQGDEPFIDPRTIDALAALLKNDAKLLIGTVIKEIAGDEEFKAPQVVKCVVDEQGYALYFSRSPIPAAAAAGTARICNSTVPLKRYKHLGLYAYRKEFLLEYTKWPRSPLECSEQLEQLRVLEKGHKIKTIVTEYESLAIDTPEDMEKALEWLKRSR